MQPEVFGMDPDNSGNPVSVAGDLFRNESYSLGYPNYGDSDIFAL